MNDKFERIQNFACIFTVIVISICIGFYIFTSVRDNGRAINNIRNELTNARTEQREVIEHANSIERGLTESERTVAEVRNANQSVTESIISVENRNEDAQRIIAENRRIITESRGILESIRKKQ